MTQQTRLATAQWALERNLAWIAASDVKAAFIVALDGGMIAGLAAIYIAAGSKVTAYATFASATAVVLAAIALGCVVLAVFPRTKGPEAKSLLYFGDVGTLEEAEYCKRFREASDEDLLSDWMIQVYRNAAIAKEKHALLQRASGYSFLAGFPWIVAIGLLANI
jgi:hypothetical protein